MSLTGPHSPSAVFGLTRDVEMGIPELWTDGGAYGSYQKIDSLRRDRWLHTTGSITHDEAGGTTFNDYRQYWQTPSPAARARADEIIAAFDKWQKKMARKPRGYRAAEREARRACRHACNLQDRIFETQAHAMAGLIAKARVIEADNDIEDATYLRWLAQDILGMNARAQS